MNNINSYILVIYLFTLICCTQRDDKIPSCIYDYLQEGDEIKKETIITESNNDELLIFKIIKSGYSINNPTILFLNNCYKLNFQPFEPYNTKSSNSYLNDTIHLDYKYEEFARYLELNKLNLKRDELLKIIIFHLGIEDFNYISTREQFEHVIIQLRDNLWSDYKNDKESYYCPVDTILFNREAHHLLRLYKENNQEFIAISWGNELFLVNYKASSNNNQIFFKWYNLNYRNRIC